MKRVQEWKYLFEIIRYSLEGDNCPEVREDIDWSELYRICKFHKIEATVCHGIDKMSGKERIPKEIKQKFEQAWQLETARDTVQHFSLEEILQAFESAGIYCIALKGIYLKEFYPQTDLRMMADLDILFRLEQEKEVEEILKKLGYYCEDKGEHHYVYFRKPFMNIEMHHRLVGKDSPYASYYENPWEKAKPQENRKYRYEYSWEDFYIYVIVHMAKHFQNGGSGIRSIVDIWQFEKRMKNQMDWEYVETELEKLKLKDFLYHMEQLVKVWFEDEPYTEFEYRLTELMLGSGVYGTIKNYWVQNVAVSDKNVCIGQIKVWFQTIFLPYEIIKLQYQYLQKYPFLLPIAWFQRIIRTYFKKKGRAKEVLKGQKADFSEVRNRQEVFEKLGL